MTSPRPETTDRSEQTEHKEDKEKQQGVQLSATQVAAGALAAVSSAVVASFFGLAGTLIGAALASVISTVSAALYSNSLQKTNERLRRVRGQLTEQPTRVVTADPAPAAPAPPATQVLPAHLDPRRAPAKRPRPRWTKVAVYAAAVFVMAMGIVTGIELIGQRPVSALVGGADTATTTTIGAITNASSSSQEQDDEPSGPSAPTTTEPATETSAPETPTDESTSEEYEGSGEGSDEGSDSEESSSETSTQTSEAEPTAESEPSYSSDESSEDSPQTSSAPAEEVDPAP